MFLSRQEGVETDYAKYKFSCRFLTSGARKVLPDRIYERFIRNIPLHRVLCECGDQSFVAVFRTMVMIRARLRCRIDIDHGIGEILPQGTGRRMRGALLRRHSRPYSKSSLISGIHRKNFGGYEGEVTGKTQATCPRICPISRFSALWMCSSSVVLCMPIFSASSPALILRG